MACFVRGVEFSLKLIQITLLGIKLLTIMTIFSQNPSSFNKFLGLLLFTHHCTGPFHTLVGVLSINTALFTLNDHHEARGVNSRVIDTQLNSITEEVLPLPRRVKRAYLGAEFDPGEARLESLNSEQ